MRILCLEQGDRMKQSDDPSTGCECSATTPPARTSASYRVTIHSLRRTKVSIIYKQTGNLRALQILLGHTKIESTVRYLDADVEDALALAEGTEV